uniref:Putative secreted protein n=1 Tax=Ixodes ricinus TaxID=34613 RepID=A0A6B0TXI5_IXORI
MGTLKATPVVALLSAFTALSKLQPSLFHSLWRRGAHNKHALQNTVVFLYMDVPYVFSLFLQIREVIFFTFSACSVCCV